MRSYVKSAFDPGAPVSTKRSQGMRDEYGKRLPRYPRYAKPPNSVRAMNTADLLVLIRETRRRGYAGRTAPYESGKHRLYDRYLPRRRCRRRGPLHRNAIVLRLHHVQDGAEAD